MKMIIKLLTTVADPGQNLIAELCQPADQNHKVGEYLHILQEECDRELALVEDLLSLQHIEAGTYVSQLTPISLPNLLLHLIEPFETRTQNQQQTLRVDLAANLPILNLDSLGFNRIVTELLSNACKYTPAGETIAISASLTPAGSIAQPINHLELTVMNTGVEIAPEELSRIFDKFYRIPNNDPWKHGGTGLGLSLVKKLVEQMGGSIVVESARQQTCFKVQLTIATDAIQID